MTRMLLVVMLAALGTGAAYAQDSQTKPPAAQAPAQPQTDRGMMMDGMSGMMERMSWMMDACEKMMQARSEDRSKN